MTRRLKTRNSAEPAITNGHRRNILTLILLSIVGLVETHSDGFSQTAESSGYIIKLKSGSQVSKRNFKSLLDAQLLQDMKLEGFLKLKQGSRADLILKQLQNHPEIEYIEPDYQLQAFDVPNHLGGGSGNLSVYEASEPESDLEASGKDRRFYEQWALNNKTGFARRAFDRPDLNALEAWKITKGSKDVVIGVIDTGVDFNHPDLAANMWVNEAEKNGLPGVDDDNNGYVDDIHGYDFLNKDSNPMDDQGHGTHCAGIIAGAHNGIGIQGIMAEAKIVALKFLGPKGQGSTSAAIEAIHYAIKNNIKILSNSWGGYMRSKALYDAVQKANEAGIVFIAAAGNNGMNLDKQFSFFRTYPASFNLPNIISVGSIDPNGNKSSFSNYGKKIVDVFAPGGMILSTIPGKKYKAFNGTSMATPYVSGIVGLMAANEGATPKPEDARRRIINSAVKSPKLEAHAVSGGYADAYRALTR